jgi:hypothetical protein
VGSEIWCERIIRALSRAACSISRIAAPRLFLRTRLAELGRAILAGRTISLGHRSDRDGKSFDAADAGASILTNAFGGAAG